MADAAFHNKGTAPLRVPGFGLPVDYELKRWTGCFSHGVNDYRGSRLTVREVAMLRFMNSITDKPGWERKLFDEEIVQRWREEGKRIPLMDSDEAFRWCVLELRGKAEGFVERRFVMALDHSSRCVKADRLVGADLKEELKVGVKSLLERKEKDWHPGSGEKVLNLVHPSLYPLVYGRTRALKTGQVGLKDCLDYYGKGETVPSCGDIPGVRESTGVRYRINNTNLWSKRFQWLPCEVRFSGDTGTDVEITSYINNLHPQKHEALYHTIEKLISLSIPLWNEVLIKGFYGRTLLRIKANEAEFIPEFPSWARHYRKSARTHPEFKAKLLEYYSLPDKPGLEPEEPPENWETRNLWSAAEWKWERMKQLAHPEPQTDRRFHEWKQGISSNRSTHEPYSGKLEEDFRKDGLQVIVKLSSIELTPEKPRYEGGNWHLEGMMNEHIVATAIYYYDVENVTPSHVRFRHEAYLDEMDLRYEQDDHEPLSTIFGTNSMRNEPAVQEIGSIATPDGRLLVFPNTLQHRVDPFQLLDETRAGHRRFLVLWLVDPHYRILSTANVPPQRASWWADETLRTVRWSLPAELSKMVTDRAEEDEDWLVGEEEARRNRLLLMEERTAFGSTVEENFESYNLCEH